MTATKRTRETVKKQPETATEHQQPAAVETEISDAVDGVDALSDDEALSTGINPLAVKISLISASVVGRVKKDGHNKFHDYKYATDAAIVDAVRAAMSRFHVAIIPSVLPDSVNTQRIGDKGELLTTLMVRFKIIDGESGLFEEATYPGAGTDKLDKGVYKAITGATKYFLQKLFNIATGDDPEKDADPDDMDQRSDSERRRQQQQRPGQQQQRPQQGSQRPGQQQQRSSPVDSKPSTAATPVAAAETKPKTDAAIAKDAEIAAALSASSLVNVKNVTSKSSEPGVSPKWTVYYVEFSPAATATNGVRVIDAATFSESLAIVAENAKDAGVQVRAAISPHKTKKDKYMLDAIVPVETV